MTAETKFNFRELSTGHMAEGEISMESYKEAAEAGLSLSQLMARKFPTDEAKHGSILSQALTHLGIRLKPDSVTGEPSTRLSDALNMRLGPITAPDGTGNTTPAGRLFFPEVILQTIASALREDKTDFFRGVDNMISGTEQVNAPEFKRPRIDVTAPEGSESQSVGQLAEPPIMVSVTAANTTTRIPGKGIGLIISDQAMQVTSFDLVNTVMSSQAHGERVRMVEGQLADVLNGNTDISADLTALPVFNADTLDATISADGELTQKAWIHYLRDNYQTMQITNIICTIDTALAIEGRTGKPTNQNDDPNSPRIDSLFNIDNLGITPPRLFIVNPSVVANNRIHGLDRSSALRRYINVSAEYAAMEEFVLRRAKAFRVDHGEALSRLFDDAFRSMDLVNT